MVYKDERLLLMYIRTKIQKRGEEKLVLSSEIRMKITKIDVDKGS
jgi:hypothetical protein